jgi:two-component system, NtrC family, nitrogen regulation sensor histidine kinase NtrY
MRFRRKLLLVFALTVVVCVGAVAGLISSFARRKFEQVSRERTAAIVFRFEHEFAQKRGSVVVRVASIAAGDAALRMAIALNQQSPDHAAYLNEAKNIADAQQLDFLDFIDDQGTILSSAEWPAKFGYKATFPVERISEGAFFQALDLPDGTVLCLCAAAKVRIADRVLFVIGGQRIDTNFVANLQMPSGMRALLYENLAPGSEPAHVFGAYELSPSIVPLRPLIQQLQQGSKQDSALVHWSSHAEDDEMAHAVPLFGRDRQLLGALLLTDSMRPYVELRHQIRSAALLIGGVGVLLAVVLSGWAATRVTRPVEELARAAQKVTAGDWSTTVNVTSSDELQDLAESFNQMTRELLEQRERLVQAERVAAWRELARRLAHELKNPLFPLQLTVENLMRGRQASPEQFDEIFRESSSTLLAEIANLKAIVSRFSEFSKMPQPRFQQVQLNEVVQDSVRLFQSQLTAPGRPPIQCRLETDSALEPIAADPELLHRAVSNLILNAIDAMPNGGTLTLRTHHESNHAYVEVSDTGTGLTAEDRERLFTPYFTTKQHGTGLGLAIVQSVVSDHGGRITVRSKAGEGTTFSIELPRNADKLPRAEAAQTTSGTG